MPDEPNPPAHHEPAADEPPARADALSLILAQPGAACPHCRYSLTGLSASGATPTVCPECGGGLRPGLIGRAGPRALRRLMTLMFAWVTFAGLMNATRQWLFIDDYYLQAQRRPAIVSSFVGGSLFPQSGWGAVQASDWAALACWAALGIGGLLGLIATLGMKDASPRNERRLIALLVACFTLYWGYHGIMFVYAMAERI